MRDREIRTPLRRTTLSGTSVPRVATPRLGDDAETVRFLRSENLPGYFPFTAGVFPFKRTEEAPARMFAGEGDAARTNRRFHLLSAGQPATRLSTAFDSVTLYGRDPSTPAGHLRQGRHVGCVDRHRRRHARPVRRVRPLLSDDVGVDDHQRAGADHPGHVLQRRRSTSSSSSSAPSTAASRTGPRPHRSGPGR